MKPRRKNRPRRFPLAKHLTMQSAPKVLGAAPMMLTASLDGTRTVAWEPKIAEISVEEIARDPQSFLTALEEHHMIMLFRDPSKKGSPFAQVLPAEGHCKCPLCEEDKLDGEPTVRPLPSEQSGENLVARTEKPARPAFGVTPSASTPEPAERWFRLF